ncbi:HIT domain-containing protein [Salinivibrio sp. ES.052]|uniref:HIT domain-containing protein n=1 Tax=Salinivibrio sp. ES.052 TaxID=1882823 RepID=UPI00092994E9|nr:HIT domain-containing protein [Salinivibrio sp. ES.052]SIN93944.1 Diadenosine tetraphosphate (Ap4A) hydrolase [Salinivibrio sp. ES.052]
MSFSLHSRLAADSTYVGDFPLCQLRLAHADIGPWLLLIPRQPHLREIHHLGPTDQHALWQESAQVSRCLETLFTPDKLNIAAIGNIVPQLHLHHVARYQNDAVWPNPIWGHLDVSHRPESQQATLVAQFQDALVPEGLVIYP